MSRLALLCVLAVPCCLIEDHRKVILATDFRASITEPCSNDTVTLSWNLRGSKTATVKLRGPNGAILKEQPYLGNPGSDMANIPNPIISGRYSLEFFEGNPERLFRTYALELTVHDSASHPFNLGIAERSGTDPRQIRAELNLRDVEGDDPPPVSARLYVSEIYVNPPLTVGGLRTEGESMTVWHGRTPYSLSTSAPRTSATLDIPLREVWTFEATAMAPIPGTVTKPFSVFARVACQ